MTLASSIVSSPKPSSETCSTSAARKQKVVARQRGIVRIEEVRADQQGQHQPPNRQAQACFMPKRRNSYSQPLAGCGAMRAASALGLDELPQHRPDRGGAARLALMIN